MQSLRLILPKKAPQFLLFCYHYYFGDDQSLSDLTQHDLKLSECMKSLNPPFKWSHC